MSGDQLGDRMKGYERAFVTRMPRRMPVILRVDGKAFHTLTRACEKPFDPRLMAAMNSVATTLCEEVQGAQLAYVQSDEVSLLVHNYKRLNTDAWFDNEVQKMCSVGASLATVAFNSYAQQWGLPSSANFDARVFVLPEAEVCNYFVWRQQDATRNSVQMLARSLYSHRQCENKCNAELQEMCFQKGHNWNDLPAAMKRGRCVIANQQCRGWRVDEEPPVFTQDRGYIERLLVTEEP